MVGLLSGIVAAFLGLGDFGALNTLISYTAVGVGTDLALLLLGNPEKLPVAVLVGALGHMSKFLVKWGFGAITGAPVGFIAMIGTEIGGLFLDPSEQGKGMGRRMVDHIVAIKGPLTVEVFKDNKISLPFYERYGFVIIGEGVFDASGDETFKMAMPDS